MAHCSKDDRFGNNVENEDSALDNSRRTKPRKKADSLRLLGETGESVESWARQTFPKNHRDGYFDYKRKRHRVKRLHSDRGKHHRERRRNSGDREKDRHFEGKEETNKSKKTGNVQDSKHIDSCKYDKLKDSRSNFNHQTEVDVRFEKEMSSQDCKVQHSSINPNIKCLSDILEADFEEEESKGADPKENVDNSSNFEQMENRLDFDDPDNGIKWSSTTESVENVNEQLDGIINQTNVPMEEEADAEEVDNDIGEEISTYDESLPPYYPALEGCRSLDEFQCLNRIAEGAYGVVYRFKDKRTQDIVALKKLKMEKEKEGFPITSLREINTLLKGQHPNIVTVREIVVGNNSDKIFIVMDYVEHDLKSLIETMRTREQRFTTEELKCLLKQLLSAVAHLHDNWILHRDLKTSNLLLSHNGVLKVGDFGLAREYGSPLKPYTPIVVTLWYRAPELLLGMKQYSTPIDMWSVGCIFAELLLMNAIFPGKSELEQINRIFKCLGTPTEKLWPGYNQLPIVQNTKFTTHSISNLRKRFQMLSDLGLNLFLSFLTYNPSQRITAEEALKHPYFIEFPSAIDPSRFPKWPAKSELAHKMAVTASPKPPSGGGEFKKLGGDLDDGFRIGLEADNVRTGAGFSLKF